MPKSFLNCVYYDKTRSYIHHNFQILDIFESNDKIKKESGEDTDNETDNDTHPSQFESNDKIKKENYGPYDDDTVNGVEQLEEVKSNNLDVKIEEEETDIE